MNLDDNTSNDDVLEELIAEFLDAESQGTPIDREALLANHPNHANELREFFAAHDRMVSANIKSPKHPQLATNEGATLAPVPASGVERTQAPSPPNSERGREPAVGDSVRYFGDYELLEEIARGGMGVVFKARQVNLKRIVALKMILSGQFAGEEDVQRFRTEAEAAAQLDHPGIVPIFEIGEYADQHYYSMGYVDGDSLADWVADGPLPPREAAQLVAKVCEAMAYAHNRGVIHRDLKPANILIESNGQPRVTDFGLAKKTEADSRLTGTGQILGTPAYMPPEQASSRGDEVGPLADVYSLGAVLYCLLTGRPPFQAASPMDTLLQVLDSDPIPVRQLVPTTPRDMETICAKCLNKDPAKRYSSAKELSEDLNRFLANEPIKARPAGWIERASKWATKQPMIAAILLTMPAWALGEPKIGVGLLGLVAGFHLPFRFRWPKLLAVSFLSVIGAMAIGGWLINTALADRGPGTEAYLGAIWGLATTTPVFIVIHVFLWDCVGGLDLSLKRRARRWLIGSIVATVISVAGLLAYLSLQGQQILVISEQLAKEHYSPTGHDSFSAFGKKSSSAQTQLARGRMFLWIPALAGTAWVYLVWGVFAGRLVRRFVYVPSPLSDRSAPASAAVKTVDGDVSRWVAIVATVSCAVVPFAVPKVLNLFNVDFSNALERGSILDARLFISFLFAWLAAYAVVSRGRLVLASVVAGCLALFLALSVGGTIASRMFQYREPPFHDASRQTAIRWDGRRVGLLSPIIVLNKDTGITIEGWVKPEGKPRTNVGCNPMLVENTGFGNLKIGLQLTQSLNWVAAVGRAGEKPKIAAAPNQFAFNESFEAAEWTHFAVVIRGDKLTLFVNGQRAASEAFPSDWFFPQAWVAVLGGYPVKENKSLVGLMDEIRISDIARYESAFQPQREWEPDPRTVALYHFDQTPDGMIYDHSGNKHHIKSNDVEWVDLSVGQE